MKTLLLVIALAACKKSGSAEPTKLGTKLQIALPENYSVKPGNATFFEIKNPAGATAATVRLDTQYLFPSASEIDAWKREATVIGEGLRVEMIPDGVLKYVDRRSGERHVYAYFQTGAKASLCESYAKDDADFAICKKITVVK
jgi:hypothetical protein